MQTLYSLGLVYFRQLLFLCIFYMYRYVSLRKKMLPLLVLQEILCHFLALKNSSRIFMQDTDYSLGKTCNSQNFPFFSSYSPNDGEISSRLIAYLDNDKCIIESNAFIHAYAFMSVLICTNNLSCFANWCLWCCSHCHDCLLHKHLFYECELYHIIVWCIECTVIPLLFNFICPQGIFYVCICMYSCQASSDILDASPFMCLY